VIESFVDICGFLDHYC